MQSDVTFRCDDGFVMPGVLTTPGDAPTAPDVPRPGLLLIYEALGMNAEMARVARDLAGEGWTVLIPDLFARGPAPVCVARCIKTVATGRGAALDDLDAARRWLGEQPGVDAERMGAIGFCMGGGFALLLAMTGHYRASAPFYGMVPQQIPASCPVVASYGGRDATLPGAGEKLQRTLVDLGVPHDVKTYPEAGHSFYTRAPGRILEMVGPYTPFHLVHDEPAARDARERTVAFFRKHLDA